MSVAEPITAEQIVIRDYLVDEDGCTPVAWAADRFTEQAIRDEWDYLFEADEQLRETFYRFRPTTAAELADEDQLHDLFGDHQYSGVDTTVVCTQVSAGTPGAHRFLERHEGAR